MDAAERGAGSQSVRRELEMGRGRGGAAAGDGMGQARYK